MTTPDTRVKGITPEQVNEMVVRRAQGETQAAIARTYGVTPQSVAWHLAKRHREDADTRARHMVASRGKEGSVEVLPGPEQPEVTAEEARSISLRTRILLQLQRQGRFNTIGELKKAISQNGEVVGEHELMHVLYSLSRQGLVRMKEQKQGSTKVLYDIKATSRVMVEGEPPPKRRRQNGHPPEPVTVIPGEPPQDRPGETPQYVQAPTVQPVAPAEPWPILAGLQRRGSKARAAGHLLEEAGLDDLAIQAYEAADRQVELTPVEREYLAYAKDHRSK